MGYGVLYKYKYVVLNIGVTKLNKMTTQFNPGRVRKVTETITRYVPVEAPTIGIDMEEPYTVQVKGNVEGVDNLQVSGEGRPVARVDVKGSTFLERLQAVKSAYANVSKSKGINTEVVDEVNKAIDVYNNVVTQYEALTARQFRDVTSEEVLNTQLAASDLEERLE